MSDERTMRNRQEVLEQIAEAIRPADSQHGRLCPCWTRRPLPLTACDCWQRKVLLKRARKVYDLVIMPIVSPFIFGPIQEDDPP